MYKILIRSVLTFAVSIGPLKPRDKCKRIDSDKAYVMKMQRNNEKTKKNGNKAGLHAKRKQEWRVYGRHE